MKDHGLTKSLWTHDDFEVMGWHDARLYSFTFTVLPESFELLMDLDYITKGVHPIPPEISFSFWISPVTLVFHEVQNISAVLEKNELGEVEVLDLTRLPASSGLGWRWRFELDSGEISFDASGYTQYFREEPVLSTEQHLGLDRRGGISYERTVFDDPTKLPR
jgi:hypothetical protein